MRQQHQQKIQQLEKQLAYVREQHKSELEQRHRASRHDQEAIYSQNGQPQLAEEDNQQINKIADMESELFVLNRALDATSQLGLCLPHQRKFYMHLRYVSRLNGIHIVDAMRLIRHSLGNENSFGASGRSLRVPPTQLSCHAA